MIIKFFVVTVLMIMGSGIAHPAYALLTRTGEGSDSLLDTQGEDASSSEVNYWRSGRACGANCVYLMLKCCDINVNYKELNNELVKDTLASLVDLKQAMASRGIKTEIVRTNRQNLMKLPKPLIAHLDIISSRSGNVGHFLLVLTTDETGGVLCIDGTTAMPQSYSWPEFEGVWSGHVLKLKSREYSNFSIFAVATMLAVCMGILFKVVNTRKVLTRYKEIFRFKNIIQTSLSIIFYAVTSTPTEVEAFELDMPTIETINQSYQIRYSLIHNIGVEYRAQTTCLVDEKRYFEIFGVYELPSSNLEYVYSNDGRIYSSINSSRHELNDIRRWLEKQNKKKIPSSSKLSYEQIKLVAQKMSPTSFNSLSIFDGQQLIERSPDKLAPLGVEHNVYSIIYIPRLKSSFFAPSPLEYDLWGFRTPALPKEDERRRQNRIPDLFVNGHFTIAPSLHRVGNEQCVVLTDPEIQTLWLIPDKGFAPCKREFYVKAQKVLDVEFGDWKSISNDVWISGLITSTEYGTKDFAPSDLVGLPLIKTVFSLKVLDVNSSKNEKKFKLSFSPGDIVIDETLVADVDKGKTKLSRDGVKIRSSVSYTVPAGRDDLDRVIAEAKSGKLKKEGSNSYLMNILIFVNVIAMIIFTLIFIRNRRRHF